MQKKYDTLVFIGRFQPFHNGHKSVIDRALKLANRLVILVGSSNSPRCYRNPWSWQERSAMIKANYSEEDGKRIYITPLIDTPYNDEAWISQVQYSVNSVILTHGGDRTSVGLIGYAKDHTSYYLEMFPEWGSVNAEAWKSDDLVISATEIRDHIFSETGAQGHMDTFVEEHTTEATRDWIWNWVQKHQDTVDHIAEEFRYVERYKEAWSHAPYPPTFVTVDSIVMQGASILMVRRKTQPGKGLWALPGGFVGQQELLLDAAIRELREETGLKVPEPVLRGSLKNTFVIDDPNRSSRGRTITHVHVFKLKRARTLPKVKGADDADKAKWFLLSDLDPSKIFEDHNGIIQKGVGAVR